ncbi:MAG: nucleotidyltransferase domain-containing protein [Hyphomicrobiaceae bacterium]
MTLDEEKAIARFVADVRRHYGERLHGVFLFGSRARGDAHPDSDADIAVILDDGGWRFWNEKMTLAGLAYDTLLAHDLYIQPWPISRSAWESPATYRRPRFIEAIRRDARDLTGTS